MTRRRKTRSARDRRTLHPRATSAGNAVASSPAFTSSSPLDAELAAVTFRGIASADSCPEDRR